MKKLRFYGVLAAGIVFSAGAAHGWTYSRLWGRNGAQWSPDSRLPDFSYAGYHCGEDPIPNLTAPVVSVKAFGAKGDGETDCTEAFRQAIESCDKGVITIPPGRYVINDIIWIKKSGIVLRGAGPDKTVIYCPKTLEDVRPNMGATTSGKPTSNYSWSGGFVWVKGSIPRKDIAFIRADSRRGSKTVLLGPSNVELQEGQRVTVELTDDAEGTLLNHLYSGDAGKTEKIKKPVKIRLVNRVVSVSESTVTLDFPLRLDIRKSWAPQLKTFEPTVREVGIENLAIEFPVKPYPGHTFEELGMNGIAMNGVSDCWIRNVKISNSDSGVFLTGNFCAADGILIDSARPAGKGTTGHHGVTMGQDCLVRNFDFQTHFVHDFTVGHFRSGNVIKNGRGINLSLDHHKNGPFENLFCNINAGEGTELWRCGGGAALGKHCAARGTFWGITAANDMDRPPERFGPDSINLAGVKVVGASTKSKSGKWIEVIKPDKLFPADLHAAQLERRLKEKAGQ